MQLCLKRVSGWRGAGCGWGTWMMSDDMKVSKGLEFPVVALPGVGHMPVIDIDTHLILDNAA